jgi:hypothetical protein
MLAKTPHRPSLQGVTATAEETTTAALQPVSNKHNATADSSFNARTTPGILVTMVDFVKIGLCSLDCRAAEEQSDYESASILSSFRPSRKKARSLSSAIGDENEPSRRKAGLMQRLEQFQSRGWLSQHEFRKYSAFLSTFDNTSKIGENGVFALKELEVELNLTESRMDGKHYVWRKILTPTSRKQEDRKAFPVVPNNDCSSRSFSKSPKNFRSLGYASKRFSNDGSIHQGTIVQTSGLSTSISDDGIATLFVETCFYGRLGFVQPPCCLQCTYREAICKFALPSFHCKRWVLWRKNANHPLHRSNISENVIAIQCQSARKLTAGNTVESYKWDPKSKILLQNFVNSKSKQLWT